MDKDKGIGKYDELILMLCLLPYIALSASYWVNEYYRPFLYVFLPICLLACLTLSIKAWFKGTNKRLAIKKGVVIGISISSSLMIINYLVKKPVELAYDVTSITNGRSGTMNMEIRTDDNEEVVFSILGASRRKKLSDVELYLYKGIVGFYFGDWESNKEH